LFGASRGYGRITGKLGEGGMDERRKDLANLGAIRDASSQNQIAINP
jgi:hypothetical protein